MSEYVIHVEDAKTLYGNIDFPFPLDAYLREKVVRCRDCRYFYEDRRDTSIGWVGVFVCDSEQWSTSSLMPSHKVEPDGFCAWGVPRESPDPSCDECGMRCIEKFEAGCPREER